jgi:hypothetical protein
MVAESFELAGRKDAFEGASQRWLLPLRKFPSFSLRGYYTCSTLLLSTDTEVTSAYLFSTESNLKDSSI